MALLFEHPWSMLGAPLLGPSAFHPFRVCAFDATPDRSSDISEGPTGWKLTVPLPGVAQASVRLHRTSESQSVTLEVRAPSASYHERFTLPKAADAENVSASLIHGELRVAVPRRPRKPLADLPIAAFPAATPAEGCETLALDVPGYGPEHFQASVDLERRLLLVIADKKGQLASADAPIWRLRLPKAADVTESAASRYAAHCANGQLLFTIPRKPSPVPHAVPVSADESVEPSESEVLLLNEELPGVAASDVEIKVTGRKVSVTLLGNDSKSRRFFSYHYSAQAPTEGGVRASYRDGVLRVVAAVASAPAEEALTEIPLQTDVVAELPAAPVPEAEGGSEEVHVMEEGAK